MKSLVSGITGFVGSHLAELLLKEGHEVYGISRFPSANDNLENVKDKIKVFPVDLLDRKGLYGIISEIKPDYIFHLAAQSYVPQSWKEPQDTIEVNVIGTINLFEAVRQAEIDPVIQIAGSSEEYGMVFPSECPITETQSLRPLSPYAISKVAMDLLGYQYHQSYGMKIIRTRAFNHEAERREQRFVISNFAKQIAEIEKGKREFLKHGNLDAIRDFTNAKDVVRAYLLAVEKCTPGVVYNISSGVGTKISEVLDTLISLAKKTIPTVVDNGRVRPSDVPILIGNSTMFKEKTLWKPVIPLETTVSDILNYWRERV